MTKLFFLILAFSFSHAAFAANAIYDAALDSFNISPDAEYSIGIPNVNSGGITVDYDMQTVTLVLSHRLVCGRGLACPIFFLRPYSITLPMTKNLADSCHPIHVIASSDGNSLEVVTNSCTPLAGTTVNLSLASGDGSAPATANFIADALELEASASR